MSEYRKTRKRFELHQQARFLTFSCFQRLPLFNNDSIKNAFVEQMQVTRERTNFKLVSWVIMPEHVHLVIVPSLPELPVAKVMSDLKGGFANRVMRRWRKLQAPVLSRLLDGDGKHRFWQIGGGYDRNLESNAELLEKVNYCHDNPEVRGLVTKAIDWPWSSARWYSGDRTGSLISIDIDAW